MGISSSLKEASAVYFQIQRHYLTTWPTLSTTELTEAYSRHTTKHFQSCVLRAQPLFFWCILSWDEHPVQWMEQCSVLGSKHRDIIYNHPGYHMTLLCANVTPQGPLAGIFPSSTHHHLIHYRTVHRTLHQPLLFPRSHLRGCPCVSPALRRPVPEWSQITRNTEAGTLSWSILWCQSSVSPSGLSSYAYNPYNELYYTQELYYTMQGLISMG